MLQTTSHVLMIRPCRFGFNPDTAASNAYQQAGPDETAAQVAALAEFDDYVALLRAAGVTVTVFDDTPQPHTPDSIFPNNWFSTHADGAIYLYPMEGANRRLERREDIVAWLQQQFAVSGVHDLSPAELSGRYLEGTGSMVLDRLARRIYAAWSSRTDRALLASFAAQLGYALTAFDAQDEHGQAIYHTNVMMCVAPTLAIVCLEAVRQPAQQAALQAALQQDGKTLLPISLAQLRALAGNMLALHDAAGQPLLVLSRRAHAALDAAQRQQLAASARLLLPAIDTIERLGGGGVRCMLAELFLPPRRG